MDVVTFENAPETDVSDDCRSEVVKLFPERWSAIPGAAERGWTQHPPDRRILGRQYGHVVAQAVIAELGTTVPRVFGIGDVVVRRDLREQGIGAGLLRTAHQACLTAGAEIVIASSQNRSVRRHLCSLGYRPSRQFEFAVRQAENWIWNETWLVYGEVPYTPFILTSDF